MVKQTFKISDNLKKSIRNKFIEAQQITIDKLLQELYADYIMKRVYGDPPPSEKPFYHRTGLLKSEEDGGSNLFVASDSYYHGGQYGGVYGGIETRDIEFWAKVDANPEHINKGWQHASAYWDSFGEKQIGVQDFINILNNGVPENKSIFGERPATHFWSDFLEFVSMGEYRRIFTETLVSLNVPIDGANRLTTRNRSGTIDVKTRRANFKPKKKKK